MANNSIDLDAAHDAVLAAIRAAFPVFQTVDDYARVSKTIQTPACFLTLAEFEPEEGDGGTGTGQLSVALRWEFRVVLGIRDIDSARNVRKLAADIALWGHGNRFGMLAGASRFIRAEPDEFSPKLQHYDPWLVEFEQGILLGESVWSDEGVAPSEILVGYVPDVGPGHEDDYEEVVDVPSV